MASSLLPERPLLVSPTLAATIGLEEAILLQAVADVVSISETESREGWHDSKFVNLSDTDLQNMFPFWTASDIKRILTSLQSLDVITLDRDKANPESLWLAINAADAAPATMAKKTPAQQAPARGAGGSGSIPANWQPDATWIKACKQFNIPEKFIRAQVPEFVAYWRDRGQARFSWGNAFLKRVKEEWRKEQSRRGLYELESTMSAGWQPSLDALEILVNSGISKDFIEDAVPEFVLYWRERGIVNSTWNTKFIEHIRKQWAKYSASFGVDDTPRPISADWQPSADCYEILQLAEIDEDYARSKVPEFVMYWRDSKQAKASWNTVFLQYIKQDWAKQLKQQASNDSSHAENQTLVGSSQQRIEERFQRIADRSWAE